MSPDQDVKGEAAMENETKMAEDAVADNAAKAEEGRASAISAGIGIVDMEGGTVATFVDYTPPPRPPVPPPAKYKLSIIIWGVVYFVTWFATEAGIIGAFIRGGLRFHGALFALFLIEIIVMVFFGVEIVIGLTRVKIAGRWYGLLPWLMQPRCQWAKNPDGVLMEFLAIIVHIAEDGFPIFNGPPKPKPPPRPHIYDAIDKDKKAVLRAQHKIDPEKVEDYEAWAEKMKKYMATQPGFISAEREETVDDMHTWRLSWESIDDLNNAMATPPWIRMVSQELEPMLHTPKITQIQMENPPTNAFADLLTRQGDPTPQLPPKKWKVWWTTACSLFFAHLIMEATVRQYFAKWGWTSWHPQVYLLVNVAFLVFTLSYIVNPFINMLFSEWMRRKPDEMDTKFPWKQLNDGLIPPVQLVFFIAYFAATGAVWATKGS